MPITMTMNEESASARSAPSSAPIAWRSVVLAATTMPRTEDGAVRDGRQPADPARHGTNAATSPAASGTERIA